ncbi:apoptosis-associated speck-like protein containing a CARD [Cavia porcellus]|uniref:Apoptosis-associated speck-like protein containing a CARD n=1 Tax=Cavia porcellus TaxID=10141 RepID=A0A286XDV9_CAVPO|nr:apoptosis-associated speck-like protein containing a CARD [Cavia porcellus]
MPGARDAILEVLENLTCEEFKKFKLKLLTVQLRGGYERIPRGTLSLMDAIDLSDKLVSYYLEEYGTELTATVLCNMGMQELAERLQEYRREGPGAPPAAIRDPPRKAAQPAQHFVDQHRQALIYRVSEVNGLLDALYGTVLSDEQYQQVRAESTSQQKMRKLYSFTVSWDLRCKDLLLKALRDTHPYLVADLEPC